jgi:hypothetical protein
MIISHLSGDHHLKLNLQPGGDSWTIAPCPVYRDSHWPLHAEQYSGQFAYLRLPLWSRRSDPLAFPNIGGRPSSTDLGRLRHRLAVAINSGMIDLAGGARHE